MARQRSFLRRAGRVAAAGAAIAAGGYATYVVTTWWRYGRPAHPRHDERDPLLDRFMPVYDVVERHHIDVAAPAPVTFAAARDMELLAMPLIRAIFKARELLLGAILDDRSRPGGILDQVLSLGWGVLAEVPDHEIVIGAVTKPWEADVTFRALPPDAFAAFDEPGYVKIAWTLRADAAGGNRSVFRTETRACATDAFARAKFRRYWSLLSPGILMIRRLSLKPLKADAEQRARTTAAARAS